MGSTEQRVRELISQQAADWFVANRAGLAEAERQAFEAWLKDSPLHVEEYLGVTAVARDLRPACAGTESSIEALVAAARAEVGPGDHSRVHRHWMRPAAVMAGIVAASLGLLALWNAGLIARPFSSGEAAPLHLQTRHGELLTRALEDGSVVHLNTDSDVTIRYGRRLRAVALTAGEADFEVAHDPRRAFQVFAGAAHIVDVGTQFDVRLEDGWTVVTVAEGRVAVARSDRPASRAFVELRADQQIRVAEDVWPAGPINVDAHQTTAWLHRQIRFEREPLARVASEFNRYAAKPIEITTPALRDLEISGVFATDDTEAFIAFLRSLKGVRVEITATTIRVSRD